MGQGAIEVDGHEEVNQPRKKIGRTDSGQTNDSQHCQDNNYSKGFFKVQHHELLVSMRIRLVYRTRKKLLEFFNFIFESGARGNDSLFLLRLFS